MQYEPIPAGFISVESGTRLEGPPLRIEAHRVTGQNALEPNEECDSILVTLEDDEIAAAGEVAGRFRIGRPVSNPHVRYALKVGDARKLTINLLLNLSHCGDIFARKIVERLGEIGDEVRAEQT